VHAFSLAPRVLTICCYAAITSIALSQEQSLSSAPADVKPNAVVISIPADGEFYFGKVRTAESEIPDKVKQALKDKPTDEQIVYVKAAVLVKYGTVVSIIDAIRTAGFNQIGLVANKKRGPDRKPGPDSTSFPNELKSPMDNSTRSSNATLSAAPSTILIDVRSKSRLKVNSKPIILSRLQSRLHKLVDGRSDKTIFIKAPGNMSYGDVVKVIDIAKSAGAQPIGLQVDHLR
jgi:biopolymer transport protein ExbD